ncbi:MAG: hypothetical protein JXA77_13580 [Bacteroidales bacterium]|nr:hypothetical protein [Bacteroidales bacterium]
MEQIILSQIPIEVLRNIIQECINVSLSEVNTAQPIIEKREPEKPMS